MSFKVTEVQDDVADGKVAVEAEELSDAPQLDESLRRNLNAMRQDFDRGIVLIGENTTPDEYTAALESDKTAGQTWEAVRARLLANDAALLRKAAELPEGGRLIGVYSNGELAIRQRSQQIVNARWTQEWRDNDDDVIDYVLEMTQLEDGTWVMVPMKDGERVNEHWGELRLLPHAEAMAQATGRWTKVVEILRAVKVAGFHVPAGYSSGFRKKGLVAASDAVTRADYVRSLNGKEWRDAILECRDDVVDGAYVRVVRFYPDSGYADGGEAGTNKRYRARGAVLWLRG